MNSQTHDAIVSLKNVIHGLETGALILKKREWDVVRIDAPPTDNGVPMMRNIGEKLTIETRYIGEEDHE